MDCPNCGNYIRNPLNYCPYCREPLNPVVPPLLAKKLKRKPGRTAIILAFLLFVSFAVYSYKGQQLRAFVDGVISIVKKGKASESLVTGFSDAPQKEVFLSPPPDRYTDAVTGIEFIFVSGGCYSMGDAFGDGDADEKPVHEVCVPDFYISRTEVIQGQWEGIMAKNPSSFKGGKNYPVEHVSWQDAQNFIGNLNKKNSAHKFRLPTEAEWEYACRSNRKKEKWAGTNSETALKDYAWLGSNSGSKPHPAGKLKPNSLGLYDMSGNVWEWVEDDYAPDCYQENERNNPVCMRGGNRVIRGGSWSLSARFARCSSRSSAPPFENAYSVGFRIVRDR